MKTLRRNVGRRSASLASRAVRRSFSAPSLVLLGLFVAGFSWVGLASATGAQKKPAPESQALVVDRVVARFSVPEGGGRRRPYFVYERELAFEARLVALRDESHSVTKQEPYRRHHLQAALEAYIAKTLLSVLPIDPPPTQADIDKQLEAARQMVIEEAGGEKAFSDAARAEGIGRLELRRFFRVRAMASLYLHVMVTPMLDPSPLELRRAHRRREGPMPDSPFEEAEPALRRWYVAESMREAVGSYFQNARARVDLEFL